MKISVAGTVNRDTIIGLDGKRCESFGGIIYNTIALAALCPDHTVLPVAYCGSDCRDELRSLLSRFPNIDFSGLIDWGNGYNENFLRYIDADRREETLKVNVPPMGFDALKVCLQSDLVMLNFVSGFDVGLCAAKELRSAFRKGIYMDVHSLTLGIDSRGARFERVVGEWREWAHCADIIQMNRREAGLFTGSGDSVEELSRLICCEGPEICLVTLGKEGVLVTDSTQGKIVQEWIEGIPVDVKDTTGCGDVFSAGYVCSFIRGRDPFESARQANMAAAKCCESVGSGNLEEVILC